MIPNFRCPSTILEPTNSVKGFVFGCIDYAGNGGTRIYHPQTDPNLANAAAKKINDGLFNLVEPGDIGITPQQVTDGLSNTFMFGERKHQDDRFDTLYPQYHIDVWCGWGWTGDIQSVGDNLGHSAVPINYMIPANATGANNEVNNRLCAWGSFHVGGANFCFADGSVRFLPDNTDLAVLQALSTIAKAEVVSPP